MTDVLLVVAGFVVVLAVLAQLLRGGLLSGIASILYHVALRIDAADKVLSDLGRPFLREVWRGVREMVGHYRGHVRQYSAELAEARKS